MRPIPINQNLVFTKGSVRQEIKYPLSNFYFEFENKILKLPICVPWRLEPMSFITNLFPCNCVKKWVLKANKVNLRNARVLSKTFRYFKWSIAIYLKNITWNFSPGDYIGKRKLCNKRWTFLHPKTLIERSEFDLTLHAFPFSAVKMPYVCRNMSSKLFYQSKHTL